MNRKDRHSNIFKLVSEHKKLDVNQLSDMMGVSKVTIRKDLDALEELGFLTREHGYAIIKNTDDIKNRLAVRYDLKIEIAKMASEIVNNGETILIESGSTCALLAEHLLKTKNDITVITNSAFIATYVRNIPQSKVILLGGLYQKESQVMVGPLLQVCAKEFHVDKLFIGTDGFLPEIGFTSSDLMRTEAVKNMADSANQVIVLTDSSKFHQQGVVSQVPLNKINYVFTDSDIPVEIQKFLEGHSIQLGIAD